MRLASYTIGGEQFYGAAVEGGLVPLSPLFPEWPTLRSVMAAGGLSKVLDVAAGRMPEHSVSDIVFGLPVPDSQKIICVGINYPARNDEYGDNSEAPSYPSLFVRFPGSFVGHGEDIVRPRVSDKFDYEGEIALVIGTSGRHISESDALSHVAGMTLCNDGTIRDWVRHAKFNVTQGKNFERSGSMGPWLSILQSPEQIRDIRLMTLVNGEIRQSDRTGRMTFPPERLISYISTFTELQPGDVIVTGTPTGAGARADPPIYLLPGDMVEVEADGLGVLRNRVVDEG
ncbi:MAG: fumarylacetoacetate hydrolase family protein [Rhodobacteraceae bacterium]|nr:fumarylacetoacetate hydrolase family protein [Paracoccaceae bacterium]